MTPDEAHAVHRAIQTAAKATELALRMAREHAPMGISPLIAEAHDQLSEANDLMNDATDQFGIKYFV